MVGEPNPILRSRRSAARYLTQINGIGRVDHGSTGDRIEKDLQSVDWREPDTSFYRSVTGRRLNSD
jgi:hypothetical protein